MKIKVTTRPGEANAAMCAVCIIISVAVWFFADHTYVEGLKTLKGNLFQIYDGRYWILVTSILFHGDAMHLAFNMIMLWQLGNVVEEAVGSMRYVLLVIAMAFVSNGIQLVLVGQGIGISGVVCGLIGFIWQARREYDNFYIWGSDQNFSRWMIMLTLLIPLDYWILNYGDRFTIAHVAHFAGVAAGAALGRMVSGSYSPKQKMSGLAGLGIMVMMVVIPLILPVKWSRTRHAYDQYKQYLFQMEQLNNILETGSYDSDPNLPPLDNAEVEEAPPAKSQPVPNEPGEEMQ